MKLVRNALWLFLIGTSFSCYITTPRNIITTAPTSVNTAFIDLGDGGLISQEPCGPPCYQGITLGLSVKEAASIIQTTGLDSICEINVTNISCGAIGSFFHFDSTNTMIDHIYFGTHNVIVAELIDKYGPPDWFSAEYILDDSGYSTKDYFMKLYYDNLKMVIELEAQSNPPYYRLTPETKVVLVNYQEVWWQDSYLDHNWHGYGDY